MVLSPSRLIRFLKPDSLRIGGQFGLRSRDKKEGGELHLHLRTRGKKYQKRGNKKAGRGYIGQRPTVVDRKTRLGDLEIDLVIGKGHKGALLTINDRATGVLKMAHVRSKESKEIEVRIIELLEDWIPFIRTMTSDNGKEFANHEQIAENLGIEYYFATPYHSWERGQMKTSTDWSGNIFQKVQTLTP